MAGGSLNTLDPPQDWIPEQLLRVEQALERWVPNHAPAGLGVSMRYAVLDGGKRLRPFLVQASYQACGGQAGDPLRAGIALEYVHCYSLVHDDLPAMDNDDLRRGKQRHQDQERAGPP